MRSTRSWLEAWERAVLVRAMSLQPRPGCDLPGMLAAQRLVCHSMFLIRHGLAAEPPRMRHGAPSISRPIPAARSMEYRLHTLFSE